MPMFTLVGDRPVDAYPLLRRALFALDAERAHRLAQVALRWPAPWSLVGRSRSSSDPSLRTDLAGIALASPIGLAPGFDKSAQVVKSLAHLGFGYIVIGSVTKLPRAGNPRPRMFRDVPNEALLNSLGLPNTGIDAVSDTLSRLGEVGVPVIGSVAGFSSAELIELAERIQPHVAAVEIGLICPNSTPDEQLDELSIFEELCRGLAQIRTRPMFVKLPTFHTPDQDGHVLRMAEMCVDAGIEGVSVSGTIRKKDARLSSGEGSMAGRPILDESIRCVGLLADRTGGKLAIKGSGGVSTGHDAQRMLSAGATTVEIYTSFIYRGWSVAHKIGEELLGERTASLSPAPAAS
jgi:dihydroorotate dehydrogenase